MYKFLQYISDIELTTIIGIKCLFIIGKDGNYSLSDIFCEEMVFILELKMYFR